MITLRPFGAKRYLHCVGKSVNAVFELFTSLDIEFDFFCHDWYCVFEEKELFDNCEDVGLAHHKILRAFKLDFRAGDLP